ncbi:MAG TPA: hypothetical protein DIV86_01075 [Alphaproteobacteria bacterium]|nr:hypothetical protein [Alphaproteobacteria bacterium]
MKKYLLITAAIILGGLPFLARADSEYCREYTKDVYIGGRTQQAFGTACRLPDGTWRIKSQDFGGEIGQEVTFIDEQPQQVNYVTRNYYYDTYPLPSRNIFSLSFGRPYFTNYHSHWHPKRHYRKFSHNRDWQGKGHGRGGGRWRN